MRILLVKTSSLGDVIHNLPVVSDIRRYLPDAKIDWCVEENFADIPRLHSGVDTVIPVALRRWRKSLLGPVTWREAIAARRALQARPYDAIVDTQGLLKSAIIARRARGPLSGYEPGSAREPVAACFYDRRFAVARDLHAVERNRRLAGAALGYDPVGVPDYGISVPAAALPWLPAGPFAVLLTATSRDDKLWPEANWLLLGARLAEQGWRAVLPAGSDVERDRAARLAAGIPGAIAAPSMSLPELAALIGGARAVVGVDTGLSHLAVALDVPTVALYTATEPGLTGVLGAGFCRNLGGPGRIPEAADVFDALAVGTS